MARGVPGVGWLSSVQRKPFGRKLIIGTQGKNEGGGTKEEPDQRRGGLKTGKLTCLKTHSGRRETQNVSWKWEKGKDPQFRNGGIRQCT